LRTGLVLRGAVTAVKYPVPQRAEATLIGAADHIVKTADGSLSAHAEHTLVITQGAPIVITA